MEFFDFLKTMVCRSTNIQIKDEVVLDKHEEKPNINDSEAINYQEKTVKVIIEEENKSEAITMKKDILVLLDPGHGAEVQGKRSPVLPDGRQLLEWQYAREIAHKVQDSLSVLGIKSEFTNSTDKEIGLSKRATIANEFCKKQSCILISIHCNAAGDGKTWTTANGWEVWSTESKNNSDKLAQCFLDTYTEIFPDRKLRGHKEKNFTVLYKTNCPCVLTENFFMDNKEECEYLLSEEGKNNITQLHVNAILKYINL